MPRTLSLPPLYTEKCPGRSSPCRSKVLFHDRRFLRTCSRLEAEEEHSRMTKVRLIDERAEVQVHRNHQSIFSSRQSESSDSHGTHELGRRRGRQVGATPPRRPRRPHPPPASPALPE